MVKDFGYPEGDCRKNFLQSPRSIFIKKPLISIQSVVAVRCTYALALFAVPCTGHRAPTRVTVPPCDPAHTATPPCNPSRAAPPPPCSSSCPRPLAHRCALAPLLVATPAPASAPTPAQPPSASLTPAVPPPLLLRHSHTCAHIRRVEHGFGEEERRWLVEHRRGGGPRQRGWGRGGGEEERRRRIERGRGGGPRQRGRGARA